MRYDNNSDRAGGIDPRSNKGLKINQQKNIEQIECSPDWSMVFKTDNTKYMAIIFMSSDSKNQQPQPPPPTTLLTDGVSRGTREKKT